MDIIKDFIFIILTFGLILLLFLYSDYRDEIWKKQYKLRQKQNLIDMMKEDEELGLYDIFNDEKKQDVKELIDEHKQNNMISDWLEQNKNPEIDKQVEKELEFLSKERLEKYSERFENDKSEIGNSETWGKRIKQETLEEVASDIQNQCHSFVESVISSKISYRDATDIFLFMKLAELTIKLKQYEK